VSLRLLSHSPYEKREEGKKRRVQAGIGFYYNFFIQVREEEEENRKEKRGRGVISPCDERRKKEVKKKRKKKRGRKGGERMLSARKGLLFPYPPRLGKGEKRGEGVGKKKRGKAS